MFKRTARSLAIALLFAASVIPVKRALNTGSNSASTRHVVVAVSGGDPEPTEPGTVHAILAFLGLA
jgi:hypothetical protein